MNIGTILATTSAMDVSGLTSALTLSAFQGVIEALLPIVAVAVLVGFLFFLILSLITWFAGPLAFSAVSNRYGFSCFPRNRKTGHILNLSDFFVYDSTSTSNN